MDYLHNAAYKTGLGNSIFLKEFNLKHLNSETVSGFIVHLNKYFDLYFVNLMLKRVLCTLKQQYSKNIKKKIWKKLNVCLF